MFDEFEKALNRVGNLKDLIMTKDATANNQKELERWHREVHKWVFEIHFAQEEMVFVKKLLNSDVFEPNTPNLFERTREYVGLVESLGKELEVFESELLRHENKLRTFLEAVEQQNSELESKQVELALGLNGIIGKFRMLKSEIFQYVGGILKRKSFLSRFYQNTAD